MKSYFEEPTEEPMKVDRVDRREQAIQGYRKWLEKYKWDYFCTLKITSGPPGKRRAEELFQTWIKELEKAEGGDDFRWFRVMEYGSFRSNPHFHILLGGLRDRMRPWEQRWAELGGNALITDFDPGKDGVLYILKMTDNRGDLDFDCKLPPQQNQADGPKTELPKSPAPQNGKQEQRGKPRRKPQRQMFHVCGIGAGPDGTGSGFAWVCVDTGEMHIEWRDELTKEAAEYRAIIAAVRISDLEWNDYEPVRICTDSEMVAHHFNVPYPIMDKPLKLLLRKVREVENDKMLNVEAKSIPRTENLAARLVQRREKPKGQVQPGGKQKPACEDGPAAITPKYLSKI
jgi:ribonuclease HI